MNKTSFFPSFYDGEEFVFLLYSPQKISLGLLFAGMSFLVIIISGYLGGGALVIPLWLVLSSLSSYVGN